MTKQEARNGLVLMMRKVSVEQGQTLEFSEIHWLIDNANHFNDEELGSMIGEAAVPTFRKIVAIIS